MHNILQAFRRWEYTEAHALIKQTPISALCNEGATILHVVATICDDGSAMKIALEEGYGYLLSRRASNYDNDTPLHVLIKKGNIHAFNQITPFYEKIAFDQETQNECMLIAVKYQQEAMISVLLQHLTPSQHSLEEMFQLAVKERCVKIAALIFHQYREELGHLLHQVLFLILRSKINRPQFLEFMRDIVGNSPGFLHLIAKDTGKSLLHISSAFKDNDAIEFSRFLVTSGSPLDLEDKEENTPMHIALSRKNYKCLGMLLSTPKCPLFWNHKSNKPTLFSRVLHAKNAYLLDMMLTGNKQLREDATVITSILMMDARDLFQHTITTYPEIVQARGPHGRTLLLLAIYLRVSKWYIDLILECDSVCLDATDDHGHTALHYAAAASNAYIVDRIQRLRPELAFTYNNRQELPVDCVFRTNSKFMLSMCTFNKHIHLYAGHYTIQQVKQRCPKFEQYIETPPSMLDMVLELDLKEIKPLKH